VPVVWGCGELTSRRNAGGKRGILLERAERLAALEAQRAFGKGGVRHPSQGWVWAC